MTPNLTRLRNVAILSTLVLLNALVFFACMEFQIYCIDRVQQLRKGYSSYLNTIESLKPVIARVSEKSYFSTGDLYTGRIRYISVTYSYSIQGKMYSSSCISYLNCAGLPPEDFSRILGKNVHELSPRDSLPIFVSSIDPSESYISAEDQTSAKDTLNEVSAMLVLLFFVSALVQLVVLSNGRGKSKEQLACE